MRFIYSIHIIQVFSFVCVLTWSLLAVKKKVWATLRSVSFRALIQNFRRASPPFICGVPPPQPQAKFSTHLFAKLKFTVLFASFAEVLKCF